jgi:Bacterial Ig domain/Purple acid Phosphatase, N-terminal domain
MEFRLSHLLNFIRRGFTGGYLDAASYYKMVAQQGFAMSDGFDWRSRTSDTDSAGNPAPASANSGLAMRDWADIEHTHAYGMMDYYEVSGDETIRDAIIEGPKDRFLNTSSVVNTGRIWNARAVGNYLMWDARLYRFLSSIGDTDAPGLLSQGQSTYNLQVKDDLCVSGYPAGCTFTLTGADTTPYGRGTSRTRGITYQWAQTITQEGGCTTTGRAAAPFQTSILLQGLWEFRDAAGPAWADYTQSLDLAYGMAQWSLTEAYSDDASASWSRNGFRYYITLDRPNACDTFNYPVRSNQTVWFPFYVTAQYEGSTSWNRKLQHVLQRDLASTSTDEFFHFTLAAPIYAYLHPTGQTLQTVPVTNVASNGGGSYTISWAVPAGAAAYRVKWSARQIQDWIGFDAGTNSFVGNPAVAVNWFAATDAPNIPAPSGSTQSMTINTGVTGLTAANFMVKAYVTAGGTAPPPPVTTDSIAPTVSLSSPVAGSTVSGTVTVTATATDNVGVTGVQFKLDGANLGAAAAAGSSYSVSWTTTTASNGSHVLSATAVDAAGNSTTSAGIAVTVNNASSGPVISSVAASGLTTTTAAITWTTDAAADSQVAYGTTAAYGLTSALNATMVTAHSVSLAGLTPGTTYHFKVMSRNSQGTLASSGDLSFTTATSQLPSTNGGKSVPVKNWTVITADGYPAQVLGYDKSVYVNSRKAHCIWGAYHQTISSEPNDATVCYSYAENRWHILQNNGMWHSDHNPSSGHTTGIWAYMPDRDALVGMTDGSGSNSPERFLGHWWQFDVAGLTGQDKEFSPRPWLGMTTPDAALTYDTANLKLVLFPDINGAVQVCDPAANTCSAPKVTGVAPPAMGNVSLVFNSTDRKVYLYGGGQAAVYTFDVATNVWSKPTTTCSGGGCVNGAPPARRAAGWAYSPVDRVFLMAGGVNSLGGTTAFTDTWIFDPATLAWTEQTPATRYSNDSTNATFDRVTYDADSNVFLLIAMGGANNYSGGVYNSYSAQVWAYAYSAAQNCGRTSNTYTPPAGSLNRVTPTSTSQSWAFDPAIATSGTTIYAGWIETGAPFDTSSCGQHHPYIQSGTNMSTWTGLPQGSQAAACTALDSEPAGSPGNSDGSKLRLAMVNGRLWEAHEKWNLGAITSSAWAKYWSGTAWTGGQVGCFSGACSGAITQRPDALIANGSTPAIAVVEENHSVYVTEAYLYVAQWNGTSWAPLGGKLNVNGTGSRVLFAALASNGTNPAACWSEEVNSGRSTVAITPQIQCAQWTGSGWTPMGTSLNRASSSWAYSPSMTYAGGKYYTSWVERTTSGPTRLYVCRWDGSTCTLLGGGALNLSATNGSAAHPSLSTDGTNVYLAWEEQSAQGQKSLGYVKKWDGSAWTQVGGAVNADPTSGSVEGISLALAQGIPTAIWTELTFGNLRQVYVKQWNGSAWTGAGGVAPPPPPPTPTSSCDLNGDGKVDSLDIQLAVSQALGTIPCTTADLQQIGQCTVVGVQRVINASLGGACKTGI